MVEVKQLLRDNLKNARCGCDFTSRGPMVEVKQLLRDNLKNFKRYLVETYDRY
jgi:hypothetical protein